MSNLEENIQNYITLNRKLKELNEERKKIANLIKLSKNDILKFVKENHTSAIKYGDCTIKIYHKKIYEKESVKDRLKRQLESNQVEKIIEILNNKKFEEVEDLRIRLD